jgi:hypothetical protein
MSHEMSHTTSKRASDAKFAAHCTKCLMKPASAVHLRTPRCAGGAALLTCGFRCLKSEGRQSYPGNRHRRDRTAPCLDLIGALTLDGPARLALVQPGPCSGVA